MPIITARELETTAELLLSWTEHQSGNVYGCLFWQNRQLNPRAWQQYLQFSVKNRKSEWRASLLKMGKTPVWGTAATLTLRLTEKLGQDLKMVVAFSEVRSCPALRLRVHKLSTSFEKRWQVTLGKFYITKKSQIQPVITPEHVHGAIAAEGPKLCMDVTWGCGDPYWPEI